MSFDTHLLRLEHLAGRDPAAAWSERTLLLIAGDGDEVVQAATLALAVGGLALGRWSEVEHFAAQLLARDADPAARRCCWRLRAVARLLLGEAAESELAARQGVAGPDEACRLAAVMAQALTGAGRLDEAAAQLRHAAHLANGLPPADPAAAQAVEVADAVLERAVDLHQRAHRLALEAGDALVEAADAGAWRARHRALARRAHALLDLEETVQPGLDLEELMRIEDEHQAGPGERFWSAAAHCRILLLTHGAGAARAAWEAAHDFAQRAVGDDPDRDLLLGRLAAEFSLEA